MKTDRALIFFDLEATGVSVSDDRIVDIAMIRKQPDGTQDSLTSLVNPGVPIPKEATAIHHITDAMVAGAPTIKELAPRIIEFMGEADLGGFNILKYDLPLLSAEFRRAGYELILEGRRIADAFAIFQKMEPRNLTAAYKIYCGKPLENAHRAEADARASFEIFEAQLGHYPALPQDIAGISAFCMAARDANSVDRDGKFVWREGEVVFGFGGKHRGKTLREVVRADRGYINWMIEKANFGSDVTKLCRDALDGNFPTRKG